jgi:type I restriction enzyme M protein
VGVRQMLVDDHQLEAVISLPAGVFKPYAGVSTAILIFTKGGRTDHVWFYDVKADGFSLDDKRTPQPDKNDLPDLVAQWKNRDASAPGDRTAKHFFVSVEEIRGQNYDLSLNRYQQTIHTEVTYEPPKVILAKIKELESGILADIEELEAMLP